MERQLGSLPPRVLCSQDLPGPCRTKAPTALGVPGKRHKSRRENSLRRVTSLARGSRNSVATATTVPACVGVLTVPKLGPPAQDLIGAVLPTATGHAGGRVINFKPARQTGKRHGCWKAKRCAPRVKDFSSRSETSGMGPKD